MVKIYLTKGKSGIKKDHVDIVVGSRECFINATFVSYSIETFINQTQLPGSTIVSRATCDSSRMLIYNCVILIGYL